MSLSLDSAGDDHVELTILDGEDGKGDGAKPEAERSGSISLDEWFALAAGRTNLEYIDVDDEDLRDQDCLVWVVDDSEPKANQSLFRDSPMEGQLPRPRTRRLSKTPSNRKMYASRSRMKRTALGFLSNIIVEERVFATIGSGDERESLHSFERPRKDSSDSYSEAQESESKTVPAVPLQAQGGVGIRLLGNSDYEYVSKAQHANFKSKSTYAKRQVHARLNPAASMKNAAKNAVSSILPSKPAALSSKQKDDLATKESEAWEEYLLSKGVHDRGRVMMSWNKGYPSLVFSVIKYDASVDTKRKKKLKISKVVLDLPKRKTDVPSIYPVGRRNGISYARYINLDWARTSGDDSFMDSTLAEEGEDYSWDTQYDPLSLDDPQIRQGKHRIVKSLDGYYFSVLPYTKKKDLKAELNEVFREKHPDLPASMSLSKIRNLKREVLDIAKRVNIELSTVALSYVYFEKLVLKRVVNKANRKLVMSVCLLLALKFNESTGADASSIKTLLEEIDRVQGLSPKQVLTAEFAVFSHLLFRLNVSKKLWMAHLKRLLKVPNATRLPDFDEDDSDSDASDEAKAER